MVKERDLHEQRIITDPEILAGKPVVRGTRIPVDLVLQYLAANPNFDDLFADYPRLTVEDVKACFAYAQAQLEKTQRRKRGGLTPRAHPTSLRSSSWMKASSSACLLGLL